MKKEAGNLAKNDEDVLAVALFPQVAPKFLENKYNNKKWLYLGVCIIMLYKYTQQNL